MKVILDDNISNELKEFLLTQEGILEVKINEKELNMEVEVIHNEKTTPIIIMKYIELFQNNNFSSMMAFDKEIKNNKKELKYIVEDICCEYCYMGLIKEMFNNNKIYSVKTNFDVYNPAINIEFNIEYSDKLSKEEVIKFIEENK